MGGYSNAYEDLSSVEIFDGTSWRQGPEMKTARSGATSVVNNDKIYVMGGYNNTDKVLSSVETLLVE